MSSSFGANQYNSAFVPTHLQNYEVPHPYKEDPNHREGSTKVVANDRGHLLDSVPRSSDNPWGQFVGTWELPKKIPNKHVSMTSRSTKAAGKLSREQSDFEGYNRHIVQTRSSKGRHQKISGQMSCPEGMGQSDYTACTGGEHIGHLVETEGQNYGSNAAANCCPGEAATQRCAGKDAASCCPGEAATQRCAGKDAAGCCPGEAATQRCAGRDAANCCPAEAAAQRCAGANGANSYRFDQSRTPIPRPNVDGCTQFD